MEVYEKGINIWEIYGKYSVEITFCKVISSISVFLFFSWVFRDFFLVCSNYLNLSLKVYTFCNKQLFLFENNLEHFPLRYFKVIPITSSWKCIVWGLDIICVLPIVVSIWELCIITACSMGIVTDMKVCGTSSKPRFPSWNTQQSSCQTPLDYIFLSVSPKTGSSLCFCFHNPMFPHYILPIILPNSVFNRVIIPVCLEHSSLNLPAE